jgi:integrase
MDCGHVPLRTLPYVRMKIEGYVANHHTPSASDVAAVLRELSGDFELAVRVLATTGARVSELCALRGSDLDVRRGMLRLDGKTGPRSFPLPPELLEMLRDRSDRNGPLLDLGRRAPATTLRDRMERACKAAGVAAFTPHGLRRFVVDRMARAGVDIGTAASLTGHSPVVMLKAYRQVSDLDRVRAVAQARLGHLAEGEVLAFPRAQDAGTPNE